MQRSLSPEQLRSARRKAGFTQQQAAARLGVSQAYLALIERGHRPVTDQLGTKFARVYRLGPLALPRNAEDMCEWNSGSLARALGRLGYPGFRQLAGEPADNPATILLATLASPNVEVRVIEAMPWLAVEYLNLDWAWLIREAKIRDLQNRLGYVVTLARQVAEKRGDHHAARRLHEVEEILERARLVREDTLCQDSLSKAERLWLKRARPDEANHWNLLTDLNAQDLPYAA